jgi:hypothetical protein
MPPMLRWQACLLLLVIAATATAQAHGALSDDEALSRLTGVWSLHRTIIDSIPNDVSAVRKRCFEILGPDRLLLRIDEAELRAPVVRSELIWERVTE